MALWKATDHILLGIAKHRERISSFTRISILVSFSNCADELHLFGTLILGLMVQRALRAHRIRQETALRRVAAEVDMHSGSSAQDRMATRLIAVPPSWVWFVGDLSCLGNSRS